MWAYKSYNDDAPPEPQPRFPAETEDDDKRKGAFSWSSLYSRGKATRGAIAKSPIKTIAGFLGRSKSRSKPPSRRASFASLLLSRRSGHDERLDKIIEMLELLAEDKVRSTTASLSSSRRSRRSARDDDFPDDSSDEEDSGRYPRSRPSARRRFTDSRSSRHDMLADVADASLKAAMQDWHDPADGKKGKLNERLKSSIKAGVKQAGKSGFEEAKGAITGRRQTARISSIPSDESDEDGDALGGRSEDKRYAAMLAQMSGGKARRADSPMERQDKDRHARFKHEVLGMPEDSPGLNEDLLDGLFPPAEGYDLSGSAEPPPRHDTPPRHDILPKHDKKRPTQEATSKAEKGSSRGSTGRPLHFDPSLPSVQAFAWPDAEEIAGHDITDKREGAKQKRDRGLGAPSSSHTRSSMGPPGESVDREEAIREMLRLHQAGFSATEGSRGTTEASGRVPSPLKITSRRDASRGMSEGRDVRRDGPSEDFGIAWPSTPTHEPGDTLGEEPLPKYVSPATEAFNLTRSHTRERSPSPRARSPEAGTVGPRTEGILFTRVISTMSACLGKAKALAQKQHQYQGERLSTTAESMVLRVIGSWLMKQIPPLERAGKLFSFTESDCMFEFLEELVRMDGLLAHPVLQRDRWEADVYEHLQAETESVQKCFLGVASSAVLGYLQHTCAELTQDMPRVLHTCCDMLKERPKDPSQVALVLPKIRAQLRDALRSHQADIHRDLVEEAEGLLDILYDLTVELAGAELTAMLTGPSVTEPDCGKSQARDPPARSPRTVSKERKPDVKVTPEQQLPLSKAPGPTRGLAAEFYDAPEPSTTGFSKTVLAEMEKRQDALKRPSPTSDVKSEKPLPSTMVTPRTLPTADSQHGSLLMEKPRVGTQPLVTEAPVETDREGRGSSSSSDEGYQSGMEASILPLLLRKKLEGKKKNTAKPSIPTNIAAPESLRDPRSIVRPVPRPMEVASRERQEGITKVRSPGSYFPAAESLKMIPRKQEDVSRLVSAPSRKPSIYTPLMASPLRASTSRPASPIKAPISSVSPEKRQSMTSPTGLVFSDPFPKASPIPATQSAQSDDLQFYTPPTTPQYDSELTPAIDAILEESQDSSSINAVEATAEYTENPNLTANDAMLEEATDEDFAIAVDLEEAEDSVSDNESIRSTDVLTSQDIRDGILPDHADDDLLDRGQEALTEAEKDLARREPDALVPGPRRVINARDVRDGLISYDDVPTYTGAVPRVEVTPGAIQNTRGEVIPIEDEDIHLAAGETLIDGTGRVWNAKGMIEPGRDEQGEAILYEVDVAQIRQANNGELPQWMPWDDKEYFADGWRTEGPRTPSYHPSDDTESVVPFSDMSFDSPLGTPGGLGRRDSDADYLDRIDEQLNALGPGDGALDDIEMAEVAEEQEAAEEAEEEELRARKKAREEKDS